MSNPKREAMRLLTDDGLDWSADFEAIRKPLAALLERLEQSPSHQFDHEVDAIVFALIASPSPNTELDHKDPFEHWFGDSMKALKRLGGY